MNLIGAFILGLGVGAIITFFTIILFTQQMEKNQKKVYTQMGRDKLKTKW